MYRNRNHLVLAVVFFVLALLTFLLFGRVSAEAGLCESITNVAGIETYGDLNRVGLNENINLDIGYSEDFQTFLNHYRDSMWQNWRYPDTQTDVAGYPVLQMLFYIGYDEQYDYLVKLYQNQNNENELIALTWSYIRFNDSNPRVAEHPDCGAYYVTWEQIEDLIFTN